MSGETEQLRGENERLRTYMRAVEAALVNRCECGGGGPDECCPACQVYHDTRAVYEAVKNGRRDEA